MKFKLLLVVALLLLPSVGLANINSAFDAGASYSTGVDSTFDVKIGNFRSTNSVAVLTFLDSKATDIKTAFFYDQSGWVKLTPYQSGSDVIAKFTSNAGLNVGMERVVSLRVNFNNPKTYIVGFSLVDNDKILSSAAFPIKVTGKVLGTTITSTRSLSVGSRGADVTALQNRLTQEGVYSGPITGYFGSLTKTAVVKYQKSKGINPNGVYGPSTQAALAQ